MSRVLPLLLVAITLLSSIAFTAEASIAPLQTQPVVYAQRDVEIRNAGVLLINDTFTLEAPQGSEVTISSLKIGFHKAFTAEGRSFYIWEDGAWLSLVDSETDLGDPRFYGYELKLPSQVLQVGGASLRVRASYLFINRVTESNTLLKAAMPLYPSVQYNITSFAFKATLPMDAILNIIDSTVTFTNSSAGGRWTLEQISKNLAPMQNKNVTITYDPAPDDDFLGYCVQFQREISITPSNLRLKDEYILVNLGPSINQFTVELPHDASDIVAGDAVGPLTVRISAAEGNKTYADLLIYTRTTFLQGSGWGFRVEYSLPREGRVSSVGDRFILTYPSFDLPYYIRELSVVAILPEGGGFVAAEPKPASINQVNALQQQVRINIGSAVPPINPVVTIDFSWSLFWAFFRPLQWVLIALGVVGSVYVLKKRKPAEEKPAMVRRTDLEEFVSVYKERAALLAELGELDEGFERKTVSREQYDHRTADISRRLQDMLRHIKRLDGHLEASEPAIAGRLKELREAEEELERVNADLRSLDTRLRAKRISRKDFEQRRRESLKRRGRALRRIENAIAELQA